MDAMWHRSVWGSLDVHWLILLVEERGQERQAPTHVCRQQLGDEITGRDVDMGITSTYSDLACRAVTPFFLHVYGHNDMLVEAAHFSLR